MDRHAQIVKTLDEMRHLDRFWEEIKHQREKKSKTLSPTSGLDMAWTGGYMKALEDLQGLRSKLEAELESIQSGLSDEDPDE
jgi:hypothetical protein